MALNSIHVPRVITIPSPNGAVCPFNWGTNEMLLSDRIFIVMDDGARQKQIDSPRRLRTNQDKARTQQCKLCGPFTHVQHAPLRKPAMCVWIENPPPTQAESEQEHWSTPSIPASSTPPLLHSSHTHTSHILYKREKNNRSDLILSHASPPTIAAAHPSTNISIIARKVPG